jgi:peptide/nickel transport system substrate-binding protein
MAPFDNSKFRQAFAAALNRQELVDTVFLGQAKPLYSMIPTGMAFHEDAYKTLGDANTTPLVTMLQEMGYSESATNPVTQYGLALLVLGIIVVIAGFVMSKRKKA